MHKKKSWIILFTTVGSRIGEKKISSDGQWVAFTVDPQEGDGKLIVKNPSKSIELEYSRGYAANFSSNSHFLVFKIKPNIQRCS